MMISHEPLPPFAATSGMTEGKALRLLIVGEAWGEAEAATRRPFVGSSGKELFLMLGEALPSVEPELHAEAVGLFRFGGGAWLGAREQWLRAASIGMTSVLALRPPENKIEALCLKKTELPDKGKDYVLAPLYGKYLDPQYLLELERLRCEIAGTTPNLILALGNTACWACLGSGGIGGLRGTVGRGLSGINSKILTSYSPSGVMRNWAWRPIVVADLIKAWRESERAELTRPTRNILICPTIQEIQDWTHQTLTIGPKFLSVDIETSKGMITCIGFGRSTQDSIVIPFLDSSKTGNGSFWPTQQDEESAWLQVSKLLASRVPKLFQNGMYDLQYLLRLGLRVNAASHDSMLLHHSIFPEMNKGLGFLGSIYSFEPAWKLMRKHRGDDIGVKADE